MRPFRRSHGPVHPATHRVIHFIWNEINEQRVAQEDLAERAGVTSSGMRKWRGGVRKPNVVDIEAVLNVLGYELYVREKSD